MLIGYISPGPSLSFLPKQRQGGPLLYCFLMRIAPLNVFRCLENVQCLKLSQYILILCLKMSRDILRQRCLGMYQQYIQPIFPDGVYN